MAYKAQYTKREFQNLTTKKFLNCAICKNRFNAYVSRLHNQGLKATAEHWKMWTAIKLVQHNNSESLQLFSDRLWYCYFPLSWHVEWIHSSWRAQISFNIVCFLFLEGMTQFTVLKSFSQSVYKHTPMIFHAYIGMYNLKTWNKLIVKCSSKDDNDDLRIMWHVLEKKTTGYL